MIFGVRENQYIKTENSRFESAKKTEDLQLCQRSPRFEAELRSKAKGSKV